MPKIPMATIQASATEANLRRALNAETLASRRYMAYAQRADAAGNSRAAAMFRDLANRTGNQAQGHQETLEVCSREAADSVTDRTVYTVHAAIPARR